MAKPLRLALFAGAAALGAAFAAAPAAAQFVMPWGGWSGPQIHDEDDYVVDRFIPPRVVGRIVAAQGYRLAAAPRLSGDTIVAIGQNAQGQRARFLIDGYSGELLRRTALGGGQTYATRQDPDAPVPEALIPGAPNAPGFGDEAPRKAKPKAKPHPKTAARKPTSEPAAKVQTPAPSQAVKEPVAPAPAEASKQTPTAVAPAEAPKTSAAAPQPTDKTPLAPDAAAETKPAATPAPQQAAVPTTPAAPEKPPLTQEAAPEAKPATQTPGAQTQGAQTQDAKPTDIGPRVQSVAPQAKAAEPAEPAQKTAEPAAEAQK